MKITAVITVAAISLAVTGCTTSDPTPPGSLGATAEEGEGGHGGGEEGGHSDSEKTGHSGGEESGHSDGGGQMPDAADMDDEVCIAFFEGAAPLAGRTQDLRTVVSEGAETGIEQIEFQEVEVLASRLQELGDEGTSDQSALLKKINAPFEAVQQQAADDGSADSGTVSYDSVNVKGSQRAQTDFTESCSPG